MNAPLASYVIQDLFEDKSVCLHGQEVLEAFEKMGVLVFPKFFDAGELASIRKAMELYFAPLQARALEKIRTGDEKRNAFSCDIVSWDPLRDQDAAFRTLHAHPRFNQLTEILLGTGFTAPGSLVMFSVGGGRGQAWHQDCPSDQSGAFNLNRLIYADDIGIEDGAIVVVPGSHLYGRIPAGGHQAPMEGEVILTPSAGTVIFLHGHVYHRVTPNLNWKPRTSVNFRAFPAGISPDVTCIGVYRNGSVNFCDQPKFHDGTPASRQ